MGLCDSPYSRELTLQDLADATPPPKHAASRQLLRPQTAALRRSFSPMQQGTVQQRQKSCISHQVRKRSSERMHRQNVVSRASASRSEASEQHESWCTLRLQPPKPFEQKTFDDFLKRQEKQVRNRDEALNRDLTMPRVERLIARGLMRQDDTTARRLLTDRKNNTESHAEFLERQTATSKRRVHRIKQGPTSRVPLSMPKRRTEEDFDAFIARQAEASAR
jgi:hypothetical protein